MSILAAIAGTRAPNIVGSIEQGRTDVLSRRKAEQDLTMGDIEIAKANAPAKVSFKDQLAEMQAKSELAFRIAGSLLAQPPEQRAAAAAQLGAADIDVSDEALQALRSEAVYGMDAVGEFGKAEEDAAMAEAKGDAEGAAAIRAAAANKYAKDGKLERVELHPIANPAESFWVTRLPNGKIERDGRILSEKELDKYTEEGVKKAATGAPKDFGLTKPTANLIQKDIAEGKVSRAMLRRVEENYKKDFLTLQGKVKGAFNWAMDKVDVSSKEGKAFLAAKTKFDIGVNQAFNLYRRWVTGAAAAQSELEALQKAYINTKDSPTEFMAKLTELYNVGQRIEAVRAEMLQNGLDPNDPNEFDLQWKQPRESDLNELTPEDMVEYLENDPNAG